MRSRGFTLIEISVVLVVIGLLVAGVMLAQSLIRTYKVQTVITDVSTFQTGIVLFRQKYNAIPGDMPNATTYWGTNPNCATNGGTGTGTQTCNGNGSGHITENSTTPPYEQFLVWQHLANGGFIQGTFTGTSYPGASTPGSYCYPGVNCPMGKVNQLQTYDLTYQGAGGWDGISTQNFWDSPQGHYLLIGMAAPLTGNGGGTGLHNEYPFLSAPEAYMLDSKVDDGLPGMGLWRSFGANGGGGKAFLGNCVIDSTTGAAMADGTLASEPKGAYNIAYGSSKWACTLLVQMNFQ